MRPPRYTERVLRALIRDRRLEHGILGDLTEEWEERAARDGVRSANRWYRREALRAIPHAIGAWRRVSLPGGGPRETTHRISSLDVKLGVRMLVKYPGLTLVGGLAIALAVAIGGAWAEFAHDYFSPTLPLDEGDRVVGIRNWNVAKNTPEYRVLHDFEQWRAQLRAIQDVGAFSLLDRNLVTDDGRAEPVAGVAISASAFRVTRVPPLLGRPLVDADERPDAPPVVVIGFPLWQTRFGGAADVVGRTVMVGTERHTIVGVMPEGFAFPLQQRLWAPLRAKSPDYARGQSPLIRVFGRLAPGATIEMAQAELSAIGRRAAVDFPATNARLSPRVEPYVESIMNGAPWQFIYLAQTFFLLILVIACANVATLVFARTATREREIAVRRALGASRTRIVSQLFVEALALSTLAAAIGLVVVWTGQTWGMDIFWGVQGGTDAMPFWWDSSLAPSTVIYIAGLAILGAALVGIAPALRATRGDVQSVLQQTASDAGGMRFGIAATGVIAVQVALSVLVLPDAAGFLRESLKYQAHNLSFQPEEFLTVRLEQDQTNLSDSAGTAAFLARYQATYRFLEERLRAEPGVIAVTAATILPATDQTERSSIEVEGVAVPVAVNGSRIEGGMFHAFAAPVLAGRDFDAGDIAADRPVAIVNESFSRELLGGRNALGRRVRHTTRRGQPPGRWLEIVGVVPDLAMNPFEPNKAAGIYQPLVTRAYPVRLAVHLRGDAKAFAPRLRQIGAAIDPRLRLNDPKTLDETLGALALGNSFFAATMAVLAAIALLLSAVGIYALMSLSVSQRTREIGIRTALGADSQAIVGAIVSRALKPVGIGAAVGALGAIFSSEEAKKGGPWLIASVVALMLVVALAACYGPLRRALRVQPTEALRSE